MITLGAVTMAYRDAETIHGTIACLANHVKKHIVLVNDKPYNGEYEEPDGTIEICKKFPHVEVIVGNWQEHVLRNIGITMCSDCDWVIGFDADEMMTSNDLDKLIAHLEKTESNAVGFISKVYWRTTDYRFDPDPDHVKVCVTRSNSGVKYVDMQCVNSSYDVLNYREEPHITHHHLSYCEPKNIYRKVTRYNHANQVNGVEWYEKYYKGWRPGDPVYQPFMTKWKAVYDPLPIELKNLLEVK